MSSGISENETEKEKIFADFNDILNDINSEGGLSYHHYSSIYDIGKKLADKEYQQGRSDAIEEFKQKSYDIIGDIIHYSNLDINQQLTIYAQIMVRIDRLAEQLKEKKNG